MNPELASYIAWPFAVVAIGLLVAVTVVVCFFRANRTDDKVREALDYERATQARRITSRTDEAA